MNCGQILIIEDDEIWQNTFRRYLLNEGYSVVIVTSYKEAIAKLENECFHLAIIDIRLVDWDETNFEGMEILNKISELGLDEVIKKIVVTSHGTTEIQREAFKKHKVLDFIPKGGNQKNEGLDPIAFINMVKIAFEKSINMDLKINLCENYSLDDLATSIQSDIHPEKKIEELTDLLKRLFSEWTQIYITPLSSGNSQSCILKVEPFCDIRGQAHPVIVKIDNRNNVRQENSNYNQFIRGFVGGGRHTTIEKVNYTLHLGGTIYSLLGLSGDYNSFLDYYNNVGSNRLCKTIKNLFKDTCKHWYESRGPLQKRNLYDIYKEQLGFNHENLKRAVHFCFGKLAEEENIFFADLNKSYPNPIYWIMSHERTFMIEIFTSVTHGDMNCNNIFVDTNSDTWLIDFAKTGKGHILRDFIELETTIKFELLTVPELKLLHNFESSIISPKKFTNKIGINEHTNNEEVKKAIQLIKCLRVAALDVIRPHDDMYEYYIGLFFHTINLLRYHWILQKKPKARKYHILLSAAMLCEKLQNWERM